MPGIIPTKINAGFSFTASAWLREYSGAEWRLQLNLRGPVAVDVDSERIGARHGFDVAASVTSAWPAGRYSYTVRATDGDAVHLVESGSVEVRPDIAAAGAGHDGRSQNRRTLDAICAVIEKRASLDQQSYKINNRELSRMTVADLLKLRSHYAELVRVEDARAAGKSRWGRQVKFRMGA